MSEINRVLGTSGAGVSISLPVEGEEKLEQEVAAMVASGEAEPAVLAAKQDELNALRAGPHKTITFHPLTKARQGEYEAWLEERARDSAFKTTMYLANKARNIRVAASEVQDDAERKKMLQQATMIERKADAAMDDLDDRITAGQFNFAGPVSVMAMDSLPGLVKLVSLMLRTKQPDLSNDEIEDIILNHQNRIVRAVREANDLGKEQTSSSNGMTSKE